ncbi:MAG TPA: twin-arginine translocase subunit TatC [Nitrospiria bacterium]|nr:twin-arginine translocase subunit TatC [Nitrospiria bacterium]
MSKSKKSKSDRSMPFTGHLVELRSRLIRSVLALVVCSVVSFYFSDHILLWLRQPLSTKLIFLSPAEAFWASIKISLFVGLLLALPVILYEVWQFVSPGLHPGEQMALFPFLFLGLVGFAAGLLFGYFVALPFAIGFLIDYGEKAGMLPMISVSMYVDFNLKFLLAFGLIFELPLAILFLTRLGVMTPDFLARNRKYAVLIAFLAAAILTPTPDVFNQTIMAVPLILLYEVGIWTARIFGKPKGVGAAENLS